MHASASSETCPKCGARLPEKAPQGLCPKCLLLGVAAPTEPGHHPGELPPPPNIEAVRAAFSHLDVLELIGQGGMGAVYKARQPRLNRYVAIKILPESMAQHTAFAERFAREGQALARLNHPNIVTIHDFGQANGFYYLLMEYVDGVSLRHAMRAGRFTPGQALAIVPMICEALQYAHDEGVLHRDIKPENILLDTKGRVRIVDFGIAKLAATEGPAEGAPSGGTASDAALTQVGSALGTPNYMAPEQRLSPSTVDQRADIYSLGVVFYEMLTGEMPVGRFAPPSRKTPLDPRVDDVVLRALAKQKEERFRSAAEIKTSVEALTASLQQQPPTGAKVHPAAEAHPMPLSPRFKAIFVVALVALLAVMLGQIAIGLRLTSQMLWRTFETGWVQGLIVSCGLGGIACFGVWLWRHRDWLIAPLRSPTPWPEPPTPRVEQPGTRGTPHRWFELAWLGMIAVLVAQLFWVLLGCTLMLGGWLAARNFLPFASYLGLTAGFWVLFPSLIIRRELRRTDAGPRSAPPAWMVRAALLALAFALASTLPIPSGGSPTLTIHLGGYMVVVALALLTRSRLWRAIALVLMIEFMVHGLVGAAMLVTVWNLGELPSEWLTRVGLVDARTLAILMQCVNVFCHGAALVALLHPSARSAFGLVSRQRKPVASSPS